MGLAASLQKFVNEETCPVGDQCQAGFVSGAYWGWGEARVRVHRILQQKHGIPHDAVCFFQDGNKWCAVFGDFENLAESPAGFGDTFEEAMSSLKASRTSSRVVLEGKNTTDRPPHSD